MSDTNLDPSITALTNRASTVAVTATARELMNISRLAPSLEQSENTDLEIAINARAEDLAPSATATELKSIGKAIGNVLEPETFVAGGTLPNQAQNSGNFLGTNGTAESWGGLSVSTLSEVNISSIMNDETLVYNHVSGLFENDSQVFRIQEIALTDNIPASGAFVGQVVFDQQTSELKYWDGSEWKVAAVVAAAGGGGTSTVDWSTRTRVTDISITENRYIWKGVGKRSLAANETHLFIGTVYTSSTDAVEIYSIADGSRLTGIPQNPVSDLFNLGGDVVANEKYLVVSDQGSTLNGHSKEWQILVYNIEDANNPTLVWHIDYENTAQFPMNGTEPIRMSHRQPSSLALEGETLVIGDSGSARYNGSDSFGRVFIMNLAAAGDSTLITKVIEHDDVDFSVTGIPNDSGSNHMLEQFGSAVAISNGKIAIGSLNARIGSQGSDGVVILVDTNSLGVNHGVIGAAIQSAPARSGSQHNNGDSSRFGEMVELRGNTLVVDSETSYNNGDRSCTEVFDISGVNNSLATPLWFKKASDVGLGSNQGLMRAEFGQGAGITPDESLVYIGARDYKEGQTYDMGKVWIFDRTTGDLVETIESIGTTSARFGQAFAFNSSKAFISEGGASIIRVYEASVTQSGGGSGSSFSVVDWTGADGTQRASSGGNGVGNSLTSSKMSNGKHIVIAAVNGNTIKAQDLDDAGLTTLWSVASSGYIPDDTGTMSGSGDYFAAHEGSVINIRSASDGSIYRSDIASIPRSVQSQVYTNAKHCRVYGDYVLITETNWGGAAALINFQTQQLVWITHQDSYISGVTTSQGSDPTNYSNTWTGTAGTGINWANIAVGENYSALHNSAHDAGYGNYRYGAVHIVDHTGAEVHLLTDPTNMANENTYFGGSGSNENGIAISGDKVLIGAFGANGGIGKVYIYDMPTGTLEYTIDENTSGGSTIANASKGSYAFGQEVAAHEDYAVISKYHEAYVVQVSTGTIVAHIPSINIDRQTIVGPYVIGGDLNTGYLRVFNGT